MSDRVHTYLYRQGDQPWAVRAKDIDTAVSALRGTLGEPELSGDAVISIDGADDALNATWPDRLVERPEGFVFRVREQPDPVL